MLATTLPPDSPLAIYRKSVRSDLEFKRFEFEIKEINGETGEFTGYASTFGNVDQGKDVVVKGAFKRSIDNKGGIVPILWQHDPDQPIGWNMSASEDEHGLLVHGKLLLEDPLAKKAREWMQLGLDVGAKVGLSIGYKVIQKENKAGVRYLKELKLVEYSVVTFPMNTEAEVTAVKSEEGETEEKGAKTKTVDGVALSSSCFAYVGDPDKTDTWKLPISFPGDEEKTKTHIRNALSRYGQTDGIPASEKPKVLAKIRAAAKEHGIDKEKGFEMDELETKTKTPSLFAQHLQTVSDYSDPWHERNKRSEALSNAIWEIRRDQNKTLDEKKKAMRQVRHDHADAMADMDDQEMDKSAAPKKEGDGADETKAGTPVNAADKVMKTTGKKAFVLHKMAMAHEFHKMAMAQHKAACDGIKDMPDDAGGEDDAISAGDGGGDGSMKNPSAADKTKKNQPTTETKEATAEDPDLLHSLLVDGFKSLELNDEDSEYQKSLHSMREQIASVFEL